MKKIKLTQSKYAIVDDEDYKYLNQFNWFALKVTGLLGFYAGRSKMFPIGKRVVYMHREVLKAKKGEICDHINNNGLDNRKINVRFCNLFENSRNRPISKRNTSGFKGVEKAGKKWRAVIRANKKRHRLGVFPTKIEAAKAYNRAALKYHGKFANLNRVE